MKEVSNFDQQIKSILDSRTLEPKLKWNMIEARLDHKNEKRILSNGHMLWQRF